MKMLYEGSGKEGGKARECEGGKEGDASQIKRDIEG